MLDDANTRLPSVAVIGGGFCGAMAALHLLRDHPGLACRIEVIEPRPVLGAGLAYSTTDPQHRINVAASRMSPLIEDELHFDRWLRVQGVPARDPRAMRPNGTIYAQRSEVGRYVDRLLREARASRPDMVFRHIRQRATSARPDGHGFTITLHDNSTRRADALVLAVGHPPPVLPAPLRKLASDPRVIADPWDQAALERLGRHDRVLILGTGLTACDVVASLRAGGHQGLLIAVSRHGLLPRSRTEQPVEPEGDFSSDPARTARDLLRRVRAAVARARQGGRPWENVIDALRRQGREVWGALPPPERLRFLRHARAFWDAHRYQTAPQIAELLASEVASGALEVLAASLCQVVPAADGLLVRVHPRRTARQVVAERRVGAIVACVGPGHVSVVDTNPVLRALAGAGALRADPYALGIEVDADARCIGANGRAAANLLVAGPLARGTDGELMGLPQVSTQPRAVAARVAALLAARTARSTVRTTTSADDF